MFISIIRKKKTTSHNTRSTLGRKISENISNKYQPTLPALQCMTIVWSDMEFNRVWTCSQNAKIILIVGGLWSSKEKSVQTRWLNRDASYWRSLSTHLIIINKVHSKERNNQKIFYLTNCKRKIYRHVSVIKI